MRQAIRNFLSVPFFLAGMLVFSIAITIIGGPSFCGWCWKWMVVGLKQGKAEMAAELARLKAKS